MSHFPVFTMQFPSSMKIFPTSHLLASQWPNPQSEELLLAMAESDYEDKLNEIRKAGSNLPMIGKSIVENDKEEFDNDADDDEGDNVEESEGEEFEEETG